MDRNGNSTPRSALAGKVLRSLFPPQPVAFCRLWLQLLPFPADFRPLDQALLHSRNRRAGFGVAVRTVRVTSSAWGVAMCFAGSLLGHQHGASRYAITADTPYTSRPSGH